MRSGVKMGRDPNMTPDLIYEINLSHLNPYCSALCEKVAHSQRFWVHKQFKLAFNNHISKKGIFWGAHKHICKLKNGFSKILLKFTAVENSV